MIGRTPIGTFILATTVLAAPAMAATLQPTAIQISTPPSSNTPADPYRDDVYLDSLTFGSTVYDGTTGSFSVARTFEVIEGRSRLNAEWGDGDNASDGDPDPFTKAGFAGQPQETTDPTVQDAALLNAFNSRSLSEITDGEGTGPIEFVVSFENTLAYDDVGGDGAPDIIFFERGGNDTFDVELMIGEPVDNPTYSSALTINSGDFLNAGFSIDTVEIGAPQAMFVGGYDFSDWGIGAGTTVGGFRLSTTEGPDLGGFFLAAEDPGTFGDPFEKTAPIPLPGGVLFLLGGLGTLGALRARRRS